MNGDQRPPWEQAIDDAMAGGMSSAAPPAALPQEQRPSWEGAIDAALSGRAQAPGRAPVGIVVRPQGVEPQPGDIPEGTAPEARTEGTAEDIGKGFAGGFGRGTTGLLGTAGTIGSGIRSTLSAAGVPDRVLDVGKSMAGSGAFGPLPFLMARSPSGTDIQHAVEPYTGKFYEPHTKAGQYASTLGEFAPAAALPVGGLAARAVNTVVPAVTSETAGQLTKGTAAEPYARALGAIFGGVGGAKMVTPFAPATVARQQSAAVLDALGVPITAGERTGSKPLQWVESVAEDMPFSSGAALRSREVQKTAVDRRITDAMFDPVQIAQRVEPGAALPRADVMTHGAASLGDEYNRLTANNVLRSDPQLHRDFNAAQTAYEANVLPSARAGGARDIEAIRNEITDKLVANRGTIPGDEYQALRSRLTAQASGAVNNDPQLSRALTGMRNALDSVFMRGLSPQDAAALRLNNQRYAIMKTLEPAIAKAQSGEHMTPLSVAQALRAGPRRAQYTRAAGVLDEFGQAAANVFKPLPQSGTAPRTAAQQLWHLPAQMVAAATAGGVTLGPLGAIGGALAPLLPHAAVRAAISRPVQAYLGNRAVPQKMRDILTQAILQQTASQPSMLERNAAERAAYERKRQQDRRNMGLQ